MIITLDNDDNDVGWCVVYLIAVSSVDWIIIDIEKGLKRLLIHG